VEARLEDPSLDDERPQERRAAHEATHLQQDGDRYVIVASKGGAPAHPDWYLNLQKDPDVELQLLDEVFPARARTAEGEERERLWHLVNQQWPDYDNYQTKTEREIPVVVLERTG
jgi:deazaflavin-dependent oxidoreductase (nitroreductase family)